MGGAYLRAFSERVADVPSYLKRHLALIRDLDEKVQALQKEIEAHARRKLAARTSDGGGGKRQKLSSELSYDVESAVTRLLSLADEKIYDFIDKHIQHLDEDLKALTQEIEAEKQQGFGAVGPSGPGARVGGAGAGGSGAGMGRGTRRGAGPGPSRKDADGGLGAWGKEGKGKQGKVGKQGTVGKPRASAASKVLVEAAPPGAVDMPPVILAAGPGEHEPVYCVCHRPSHGNMVACDNEDCQYEWFHYECVGLTEPPLDDHWYCPDCAPRMKAKAEKAGLKAR